MSGSEVAVSIDGIHQRPGALPAEATALVGRRAELASLGVVLGHARLVTVTGPGGVGKTRVALRAAATAARRYTDGVCLVELSGLCGGELIAHTVAAALGLPESLPENSTRGTLDAVLDHLRDRRMLLVLDTCEHLVDACAMLCDLVLREAPGVTVLATSRQPLDVPGEYVFPIPPLPVPTQSVHPEDGDAVALFAERAAAVVPGFTVDAGNRAAVVRLCRRLDGIPLAIELATVRLRAVTLDQLNDRLENRFTLLTGGRRTALPRHKTLHTAIAWSYDLCGARERLLWERLSVFAGGFDLAAAQEVCADERLPREEVPAALIGLVDRSIVQCVEGPEAVSGREPVSGAVPSSGRRARYRLLDTLREFGAERLEESGEAGLLRARHVAHHARLARAFADHPLDSDQQRRYRELRDQHANLRTALSYALGDGTPEAAAEDGPAPHAATATTADGADAADADAADATHADAAHAHAADGEPADDGVLTAARIAADLWPYWQIAGLLGEGRHWLGRVLDRCREQCRERARALIVRGYLGTLYGESAEAVRELEEGVDTAVACGDVLWSGRGEMYRQLALTLAGRHEEAAESARLAEERLRAVGDAVGLVNLESQISHMLTLGGRPDLAIPHLDAALALIPGEGERWMRSYTLFLGGTARYFLGDLERASVNTRRAVAMKFELGDVVGMAYCLDQLAWTAAGEGRPERAAWLIGAADPLWAKAGRRLSGTAELEQVQLRTERELGRELGDEKFAEFRRFGAGLPPSAAVRAAADDVDLPSVAGTGPSAAGPFSGTASPVAAPRPLTAREREVAELLGAGLSNGEIAERLLVPERAVDSHVEHILAKLGASSRRQIAALLPGRDGER